MDDAKPTTDVAPQATGGEIETPNQQPAEKQTAQPEVEGQPERQVSYNALREERTKRQELQRELAELKARGEPQYQPQGDEDDFNRVISHPFVQNMMLQQAKRELIDYARDTLEQFPGIPDSVKKAIVKNPRGFVQEATSDIENAKLDILEYIESLAELTPVQQKEVAKSFPVTGTNATGQTSAGSPAEVQRILEKPVDEWSKDEEALVENYRQNAPKK